MKRMADLAWPEGVATVCAEGKQALGEALAKQVAAWLREALAERGTAALAVSGGSTPVPFFQALARESLAWENVSITLVDERWVPETHDASNARLLRELLLKGVAARAHFIPLVTKAASPQEGQTEVEARLATLPAFLDVVILGMGADGHTASLFPCTPGLAQALDPDGAARCRAMSPPGAAQERITLTRSVIDAARHQVLHLTGDDKLATLEQALASPDDILSMPIRAFLHDGLTVYWSA
ncbi:6-phosphogluconolactonase [Vreelandella utahensis]|uniref:6-phosphogluconolactonase n=1 Tax=Vreelandella halophila TaxID=86177 RepID=UPI001FE35713|nr:6-phosphogluconolactonase [Halomonas utahensis]